MVGEAHAQTIAVYAVAMLLVLVVGIGWTSGGSIDPWHTQAGLETRGQFIAGCRLGTGESVDCECAFRRVTSQEPYDTPRGLFGLAQIAALGMPASGPSALPPAYRDALTACPQPRGQTLKLSGVRP